MLIAICTALGAFFLIAALHPFTTYPLSLLAIRRWHRVTLASAQTPAAQSFAICFCAYNEERVIEQKIDNLFALQRVVPDLEIYAYVDAATDRTAELLRRHADRIHLHVSPERHGKTHGMNRLVSMAAASIVVFTDANVMLDLDAIDHLRRYFADPAVGCVCGHLVYVNAGRSATAAVGSLFWRLEEWIKLRETETGSAVQADGSLFAIRRALHRPPPDHLIDDMYVSMSILCEGYRVVQANDVVAYEQAVTSTREEFQRKIRIACQCFNIHRILWPRLRRLGPLDLYKYISHKLLRWLSIYSFAAAAVAFEAALGLAGWGAVGAALAAAGILALALGGVTGVFPFKQLWEIFTALLGAGIGVWRSLKGESFQTWSPASSIRK